MSQPGANWIYLVGRERKGPLSSAELGLLISAGRLPADVLAWRPGMSEWRPASSLPEILAFCAPPAPSISPSPPPPREVPVPAVALPDRVGHLLCTGSVSVGWSGGEGAILFTAGTLFALRSSSTGVLLGAWSFGLVGALVGAAIDSKLAHRNRPPHLDHPDVSGLEPRLRDSLAKYSTFASRDLGPGLVAHPTTMGYRFSADGQPDLLFRGVFSKAAIRDYIKARRLPIVE